MNTNRVRRGPEIDAGPVLAGLSQTLRRALMRVANDGPRATVSANVLAQLIGERLVYVVRRPRLSHVHLTDRGYDVAAAMHPPRDV